MDTENSVTPAARQMESIKLDNLLINFTTEFQQIWDSTGSHLEPAAFWHPTPALDLLPGFFPLGDVIVPGYENINGEKVVAVVREGDWPSEDPARGKALSRPDDYEQVWKDAGSGAKKECTLWRPIPPAGYVALGLVSSMGHEKPSVHAVRCVRADLVVMCGVGSFIWGDARGSQYKFAALSITLPNPEAGEIFFAPGTFVGQAHEGKSAVDICWALRMKIQVQTNTPPEEPVISAFEAVIPPETAETTQVAMLPWFTANQSFAPFSDDLSELSNYRLERKDQYILVGHGHNTEDKSRLFKWTAPGAPSHEEVRIFNSLTSIKFDTAWRTEASDTDHPIQFSAKLSAKFTHTETSSSRWTTSNTLVAAAIVPKNKMLAVYQLESQYTLLDDARSVVANRLRYADSNSLHWFEYPQEKDDGVLEPTTETAGSPTVTSTEP